MGPIPRAIDGHRRFVDSLVIHFERAAGEHPRGEESLNRVLIRPLTHDAAFAQSIYLDYKTEDFPESELNALFRSCTLAMIKDLHLRTRLAQDRIRDLEQKVSDLVDQAGTQVRWNNLVSSMACAHIDLGEELKRKTH